MNKKTYRNLALSLLPQPTHGVFLYRGGLKNDKGTNIGLRLYCTTDKRNLNTSLRNRNYLGKYPLAKRHSNILLLCKRSLEELTLFTIQSF